MISQGFIPGKQFKIVSNQDREHITGTIIDPVKPSYLICLSRYQMDPHRVPYYNYSATLWYFFIFYVNISCLVKLPKNFSKFPHKWVSTLAQKAKDITYEHTCRLCRHSMLNLNHFRGRDWAGVTRPYSQFDWAFGVLHRTPSESADSGPTHSPMRRSVGHPKLVKTSKSLIWYHSHNTEPHRPLNPRPSDCEASALSLRYSGDNPMHSECELGSAERPLFKLVEKRGKTGPVDHGPGDEMLWRGLWAIAKLKRQRTVIHVHTKETLLHRS